MFINRGIDDGQLFDGDCSTYFIARESGGVLRIDLGAVVTIDRLALRTMDREAHALDPEALAFDDDARVEVSADLTCWREVPFAAAGAGTIALANLAGAPVRYVLVHGAPRRLAEIEGSVDGAPLDRTHWRASNLLPAWRDAVAAWSRAVTLQDIAPGAMLAVSVEGVHGAGKAWVAARVDGELVGFPDRAPSYPSNTWEYKNVTPAANTTHYLPLKEEWAGRPIEVVLLVLEGGSAELEPMVRLTASTPPAHQKADHSIRKVR